MNSSSQNDTISGDSAPHAATVSGNMDSTLVPGTNRHKPGMSPSPTPYEQSSLSRLDIDKGEGYYNQREPFYAIQYEKPRHRFILHLAAQGRTNKEIAEEAGVCAVTVSNVLRQPWAIAQIAAIQRSENHDEVAEVYKRAAIKAALLKEKIINTALESTTMEITAAVANACTNDIVDRVYGKAKQPIGSEGIASMDFNTMSDDDLMGVLGIAQTKTA